MPETDELYHRSLNPDSEQRIMIFVDGPNFFHSQKNMGWKVQPSKIIKFFSCEDKVIEAVYYVGIDQDNKARPFIRALQHMGFTVFEKQIRTVQDHQSGNDKRRIDIDIEMVHDILVRKDNYDTAVIVSGSRNFRRTIETLKSWGKNVVVMASSEFLSDVIKNSAGQNIYYLENLKSEFEFIEGEFAPEGEGPDREDEDSSESNCDEEIPQERSHNRGKERR